MRTYELSVNAELVDILNLDNGDWQSLANIIHYILENEYLVKLSGAIVSTVKGRGNVYALSDIF